MADGRRVAGLDVVRGIAVLLVVLRHALPDQFPGAGIVGVVMFFTLSGFLITGLLLNERRSTGRIALVRFWRRRVVRLVPALTVVMVVVLAVMATIDPLHDRHLLVATALVAFTWTSDLPLLRHSAATFHLWTLAVEEQFYLGWPLVMMAPITRRRPSVVLGVVLVSTVVLAALTVWALGDSVDVAYSLPTPWLSSLVIGGAAAFAWDRPGWREQLRRTPIVIAAASTLAVLSVAPLRSFPIVYIAGGPLIACAMIVIMATLWHSPVRGRVLTGLQWTGLISYPLYLWDYPLAIWGRAAAPPGWQAATALAVVPVAVAAAWATHRWIEMPVQQRYGRRHGPSVRSPSAVGG